MIALARIRRAAAELKAEGAEITVKALAQKAGCPSGQMSRYVYRVRGLKEEIGLCTESHFRAYQRAAQVLHTRGEFVTRDSLARELGKRPHAVDQGLSRHPEWIAALDFKTYGEAAVEKRKREYTAAIVELCRNNQPISCCAIARMCGKNRTCVSRDLNTIFSKAGIIAEATKQLERSLQAAG